MKNILKFNGILNGVTCVALVCVAIGILAWNAVELSRSGELFGWILVGELFVAMLGGSFLVAWFALELTAFILTIRNWRRAGSLVAVKAVQVIAGACGTVVPGFFFVANIAFANFSLKYGAYFCVSTCVLLLAVAKLVFAVVGISAGKPAMCEEGRSNG
jgi:hypothetical protein